MHLVYPDAGLVRMLKMLAAGGLTYAVYKNDITPDRDTILGDFDVSGFTTVNVPVADFTLTGVSAHVGSMVAALVGVTTSSSAPQNGYGYVILDTISGEMIACARFDDAPRAIPGFGTCTIQPTIGGFSQLSS